MTKLDLKDTVLSSFERIASKATAGILAAGLVLGLLVAVGFGGGTMLTSMSGVLGGLMMAFTALVYVAGAAVIGVGAFRAYDAQDIEKEMFTENILWPFLRMTGANIVLQSFIMTAMYLVAYPLLLIGGLGSSLLMGSAMTTGLGAGVSVIAAVLGVAVVALVLYIAAALTLALPRITVDDRRMFQALDESVQSTRGNRPRIMLGYLPIAVLIGAGIAAMILVGGIAGASAYIVLAAISSFYGLGFLTELNNRL